ncbi:RNA polymerase sigma factor [Neobacillus muris]|uniref:RNA polymerase sigma factor n=1 Tax=Neobacillus muris TaxID=2941334 RepID=UPI0020410072|nr:sigma-70 family RNA polymerase sigma factor [Neobacillus muris]
MSSHESCIKRAIGGDDQAFLQLMQIYKLDLYKTSLAFLRNEEEALEAIQEVMYRAYKKIHSVRDAAYCKTWLIRIMINYCNDQIKKQKRFVFNEEILNLQGISENYNGVELKDAIMRLDERSREILTLKYFNEMQINEIAFAWQCPEGTVKTWLNKALKLLREKLEEKGGGFHV